MDDGRGLPAGGGAVGGRGGVEGEDLRHLGRGRHGSLGVGPAREAVEAPPGEGSRRRRHVPPRRAGGNVAHHQDVAVGVRRGVPVLPPPDEGAGGRPPPNEPGPGRLGRERGPPRHGPGPGRDGR